MAILTYAEAPPMWETGKWPISLHWAKGYHRPGWRLARRRAEGSSRVVSVTRQGQMVHPQRRRSLGSGHARVGVNAQQQFRPWYGGDGHSRSPAHVQVRARTSAHTLCFLCISWADLSTRLLVWSLATRFNLPVIGFVDWNPCGVLRGTCRVAAAGVGVSLTTAFLKGKFLGKGTIASLQT